MVTVILEKDPFTEEVVPRTTENIIRGFMGLMPGGEEQFQQMKETGAIEQTVSRIDAAVATLNFTWAYITGLFLDLWNSFTIEDVFHPIDAFVRIVQTLADPIQRLFAFIVTIVRIIVEVLLVVMNFPIDTVNQIIANARSAFEDIKRDPIGFLKKTSSEPSNRALSSSLTISSLTCWEGCGIGFLENWQQRESTLLLI